MAKKNKLEGLPDNEDWVGFRKLIQQQLKKQPNSHWLLSRLSMTYYEERKYQKALDTCIKALKISPNCPLVLWFYGGALEMTGNPNAAIKVWKDLLKRRVQSIATGECGEGMKQAKSLLNDCRYRIGLAYLEKNEIANGKRWINSHIKRRSGCKSIYTLKEVKESLQGT